MKLTSYQGRKIICNQIVGSLSIHTLSVLHPPRSFTQDVQREINKFIWQGIHWLRPNYLYTAQEKGGQDLINLEAKIGVLRLNLANKIQQNLRSSSLSFLSHLYNLSLYGNISPHHFFCITRNPNVPESRPFGKKIIFTSFYCYPTEKKDSDVSWRLIYNCLVTPQKLFKWKIIQHQNCPWCPEEDGNVLHMIFHCKCTKALWISASKKMNQINGTNKKLTSDQALCGFQPNTPNHRLSNFILNLAKSTIYKTYSRLIKEDNPREPSYKTIFETRIKFRITLEEHKSNLYKTREKFRETFPIGNCLV